MNEGAISIDLDYTLKFADCLYKYVSVTTIPNKLVYKGWLKTIDPESGNIFLVRTLTDDSSEVKDIILIMRNSYEDVKVLKEVDPDIKSMLQNLYAGDISLQILDLRKGVLIKCIKANRLPFKESYDNDGKSLIIMDTVTIDPPYTPDTCHCDNPRVLASIRKMVAESQILADMPIPEGPFTSAEVPSTSAEKQDEEVLRKVDADKLSLLLQDLCVDDKSGLAIDLRKQHLIKLIQKNRLPFKETEDGKSLILIDTVTIYPPYIPNTCDGVNRIVVTSVRKLVAELSIPEELSTIVKAIAETQDIYF